MNNQLSHSDLLIIFDFRFKVEKKEPEMSLSRRQLRAHHSDGGDVVAMVQSRFGAAAAAHRPGPLLVGSDSDDSDVEMVSQQWDFLEIYTPPRVCFAVARYNLLTGPSMDLETGFDFMTMDL